MPRCVKDELRVHPPKEACMNLHEYQAKEIFARYGIPVPHGALASSPEAARAAAKQIGGDKFVVKAQVHAGGRGKVAASSWSKATTRLRKPPRKCSAPAWSPSRPMRKACR